MPYWIKLQRRLFAGVSLLLAGFAAQAVEITVSIPPLAGMIAPLLDKDDKLTVLLEPGVSPHGFQLKPSHLSQLQHSDLIVMVGTPVDAWLQKAAARHSQAVLQMAALKGVETLPVREGGIWLSAHETSESNHDEHDHGHGHDHGDAHDPHRINGHLWMSLENARLLVLAVSEKLQHLKTQQAGSVQQRTDDWLARLQAVDAEIDTALQPHRQAPFLVLHDAYQYFEKRYQLKGIGTLALNPEIAPSLKRVQSLRQAIVEQKVKCIFKEPQFPAKRVTSVVSGLPVKIGNLDPMGVYDAAGERVEVIYRPYDAWLLQLGAAFADCLQP